MIKVFLFDEILIQDQCNHKFQIHSKSILAAVSEMGIKVDNKFEKHVQDFLKNA